MAESLYNLSYEIIPNVLPRTTVFVHGNMASSRWWHPARDLWQRKAQGQNLKGSMILVNFRGCGTSPAPRTEDIKVETFARDFISLIENLNLGPVQLVGHSAGGFVAVLMLAKAPHLFSKALLLNPVGARGVRHIRFMDAGFALMKKDKKLLARMIGSIIYENDPDSEYFNQVIVEDAFHAAQTMGSGVIKDLQKSDIREICPKVQHEILVLHGEHDELLPVKDSQELASLLPNASFRLVSEQGHCMNIENPKAFVQTFEDFFAS